MQAKKNMDEKEEPKEQQKKDLITWGKIERERERLGLRGTTYL